MQVTGVSRTTEPMANVDPCCQNELTRLAGRGHRRDGCGTRDD